MNVRLQVVAQFQDRDDYPILTNSHGLHKSSSLLCLHPSGWKRVGVQQEVQGELLFKIMLFV